MPFDGSMQTKLTDLLSEIGIEPVPNEVLAAHKMKELAKYPETWLWRFRQQINVTTGFIYLATFISYLYLMFTNHPLAGSQVLGSIIFLTLAAYVRLWPRGPAAWHERIIDLHEPLPDQIRFLACKVLKEDPNLTLVLGELVREEVLDPYLLVEQFDPLTNIRSSCCLGIWDNDAIIEIAKSV